MAPFLSDLLITDPPDVEDVSNGAERIRTLTEAAKTTMDVEHAQTGEHQFPIAQPGTPVSGQIWFDLVNMILRRYDGSNHRQLNAIGTASGSGSASNLLTASYATVVSAAVTTFAGSRVLLFAQFGAATINQVTGKFIRDISDVSARTFTFANNALTLGVPSLYVDIDTPSAGSYTYSFQAKANTASGGIVTSPYLLALVI